MNEGNVVQPSKLFTLEGEPPTVETPEKREGNKAKESAKTQVAITKPGY